MERNKIYKGNCLDVLKTFPDNSIDCIVTSPPYWGPREYGDEEEPPIWLGDETCDHEWVPLKTNSISGGTKSKKVKVKGKENFQIVEPAEAYECKKCSAQKIELGREYEYTDYIKHLFVILDECKRVLKPYGTMWLNIGDSYIKNGTQRKSLAGVPQRVMLGMMDKGWIYRNDIIWYKPNAMPHPVKDRFTQDLEHIYQFGYFPFYSMSQDYYFNQLLEPLKVDNTGKIYYGGKKHEGYGPKTYSGEEYSTEGRIGKNMRTVWEIKTASLKDEHFAAFPIELPKRAIDAGCPREVCNKCGVPRHRFFVNGEKIHDEIYNGQAIKQYEGTGAQNPSDVKRRILESLREKYEEWTDCGCNAGFSRGIVLDPFMGSGSTALAAIEVGVDFVGIEFFQKYIDIAERRLLDAYPNYKTREAIREL